MINPRRSLLALLFGVFSLALPAAETSGPLVIGDTFTIDSKALGDHPAALKAFRAYLKPELNNSVTRELTRMMEF